MPSIHRFIGTGRARCAYCTKLIPKGVACAKLSAFNSVEQICFSCLLWAVFNIKPEKARQQMITALALQDEGGK